MKHQMKCITRRFLHNNLRLVPAQRFLSTKEAIDRRNHLFTLEKKRQLADVGRVEKIEVQYKGIPKDCTLIMNKDISTPFDCARHMSEWHAESSALAVINGQTHWDMHRPLSENCTLELQNYTVEQPYHVNKAFWRSCSLLLGACATIAFKDAVTVKLHSFPVLDIRSGSFVYDIDLPTLEDWTPTHQELYTLTAEYVKFARQKHPIERLEVGEALALEMFSENEHKSKQIPNIARINGNLTLYRIGNHVDISKGPMINNTAQIGRVSVAAVHKMTGSQDSDVKQLYRFQGVALPAGLILNHFAFTILTQRAAKLNPAKSPIQSTETETDASDDVKEQETIAAKA